MEKLIRLAVNPDRPRDKEATRRLLIKAVGELLAGEGFRAVGVNAVARKAGVDKVLIYRYYGGLQGLLSAFAEDGDFWPSAGELVGEDPAAFSAMPLADRLATCVRNYMRALRKRPLTCEILAWIFLEQNELIEELNAARRRTGQELYRLARLDEADPSVDMGALLALLGAAMNHLCVRANKLRFFAGMDLADDQDWLRLEAMMERLIRATLMGSGSFSGAAGDAAGGETVD